MSQHDYNIANQSGLEFRQDLNNALSAVVTQNAGTTEPTATFPGMRWLDTSTSPPIEKRRNSANSAWDITLTEVGRSVTAAGNSADQLTALGAQAALISGTNIKTINSTSLLGSGDIVIGVTDGDKGDITVSGAGTVWTIDQKITLGASQATTSGALKDFTIPTWIKRVTITFNGVSTSGTSNLLIQIGSSATPDTSGYSGRAATAAAGTVVSNSTGFLVTAVLAASDTTFGAITLIQSASNTFCASGTTTQNSAQYNVCSGAKELSGAITLVRITTVNGTDTFDAGSVNILYEG